MYSKVRTLGVLFILNRVLLKSVTILPGRDVQGFKEDVQCVRRELQA